MAVTWKLISLPLISGLIGWLTNVVAIRMLFWPKTPVRILGWEFMGLLPKRKYDLARSIGQAVDENLLPMDELVDRIEESGYKEHVVKSIVLHIDNRLAHVLPRFLPDNLKIIIREFVRDIVAKEGTRVIEQVAADAMDKLKEEVHLGDLVAEKISSFDLDELEQLILSISGTELRYIEILGFILGGLIGVFQILVFII